MEQEIVELLAQLDEGTLKMLPCFWDKSDAKNFRIGLSDGPQIRFYLEADNQYTLFLRDIDKNETFQPVLISSEAFNKANVIYNIIRKITDDNNYKISLNNSEALGVMISNVNNLVKPTIIKLLKREKPETEYLTTRAIERALGKVTRNLTDEAMELMGYIVTVNDNWIVKQYKDGRIEQIKKI